MHSIHMMLRSRLLASSQLMNDSPVTTLHAPTSQSLSGFKIEIVPTSNAHNPRTEYSFEQYSWFIELKRSRSWLAEYVYMALFTGIMKGVVKNASMPKRRSSAEGF